jgi:hypothetical protein
MTGSPATVTAPEWFLARDGEQFGPLSDTELRKLVEFGHLKPTDLLWREGFPEWRSARILLNEAASNPAASPSAVAQPLADRPSQMPAGASEASAASALPELLRSDVAPAAVFQAVMPQTAQVAPAAGSLSAQTNQSASNSSSNGYNSAGGQGYVQVLPAQPIQQTAPAYAQGPLAQAPQGVAPYGGPVQAYQGPEAYRPSSGHSGQPSQGLSPQLRAVDLGRPAAAAPVARKQKRPNAAPVARPDDEEDYDDAPEGSSAVRWLKRIAVLLFFTATLAAAAWYIYPQRDRIFSTLKLSSLMGIVTGGSHPLTGYKATADETDKALQANALWQVLKREFPEWYGERIKEAAKLASAGQSDADIGRQMMQAIVALRRKHAGDALSATMPRLRTLAAAFADNLTQLRQVSVDACHAFVSSGETAPDYLRLIATSSHSRALQAQLVAVFEAIADGRKIPRVYPQPKQADYNLLVTALEARGWTDADMSLFSDSRRFGAAPPEQVCKMVTDWFKAQVEMTDADAQLRLLADALKPVVAG